MGWIDKGALWCLHTKTKQQEHVSLSSARYLSLHQGQDDYFAAVHHFDGDRLEISAHCFCTPSKVLSRIIITTTERRIDGDRAVWTRLPNDFVAVYLTDFALVRIRSDTGEIEFQSFDWYSDDYDKMYQGIIGVTKVPNQELLIVSIQRDSQPVIYDPMAKCLVGKLQLADRHGNPTLYFRKIVNELWANDYDTLLRINPTNWQINNKLRLQGAPGGGRRLIGEFAFDPDENICAVARPFSQDVIGIETRDFRIRYQVKTGGQPLEVTLLPDGRVFARDWKTGKLLQGQLKKIHRIAPRPCGHLI